MDRIDVGGLYPPKDRDVQNMAVTQMHRDRAGLVNTLMATIEAHNSHLSSLSLLKSDE
jgi:hypothetical protein